MPAGTTYEAIASTTLASAQADVTFSSIDNTYTDLVFILQVAGVSGGNDVRLTFNGDTGANYSWVSLYGIGNNNVGSFRSGSISFNNEIFLDYYGAPTGTIGEQLCTLNILNYGSSRFKTILARSGKDSGLDAMVATWRSTSAITSAKFYMGGQNLKAGSTITMYGIKAA